VRVSGSEFLASSVVRWNGADRATTFVSSTELQAAISAADIASPGAAQVTVFNPTPGGGLSNAKSFIVFSPEPSISSISPKSATAGGSGFTLVVRGAGFIPSSVVRWAGSNRPTTFVSPSELQLEISAADIAVEGQSAISVFNPEPGGGISNTFTVLPSRGADPVISYAATTARDTRPAPLLPSMGPAGSVITDPTFGSRIARLTDENTPVNAPRFQVPSSAWNKMFNSDDTRVVASSESGELRTWNFDPVTLATSYIGPVPLLGDAPFWSYTDPNRIYGILSGTNDLGYYDFSTGEAVALLDPDALGLPGFTGQRAQVIGMSRDDRYIAWLGGGARQEDDRWVVRYDRFTGDWRALRSDTSEVYAGHGSSPGTLQGIVDEIPGSTLHNARMSVSGRYIIFAGTDSLGTGQWDVPTLNYNVFQIAGHWTPGAERWLSHGQRGDGARWNYQPWMTPEGGASTDVPTTILTPNQWKIDNHPSWLNDKAGLMVPVCLATYRPDGSSIERPWDNEIICVATGDPNNDTVYRFAHTRTTGTKWETIPRGNVSQSGRFFMFQSDWEGTLATGRTDIFIAELK